MIIDTDKCKNMISERLRSPPSEFDIIINRIMAIIAVVLLYYKVVKLSLIRIIRMFNLCYNKMHYSRVSYKYNCDSPASAFHKHQI
ncbi:TPA_asm: P6 [Wurfbainia alphacytorhabdovirus 1]|nr:TPA_asm: P6 [Wurfbainia alphacytorhabdovirus 1]